MLDKYQVRNVRSGYFQVCSRSIRFEMLEVDTAKYAREVSGLKCLKVSVEDMPYKVSDSVC
jgi:hypothetical protein